MNALCSPLGAIEQVGVRDPEVGAYDGGVQSEAEAHCSGEGSQRQ